MPQGKEDSLPTRRSLLHRVKNWQDHTSWQEFYNTYKPIVRGLALKAGLTGAEADDVVQDTFLDVARKMPEFNYDPARHRYFRAWLIQLTRWRVLDHLRKRARHPRANPAPTDGSSRTATIEQIADPASLDFETLWEKQWELDLMHAALEKVRSRADPEKFQMFDLCVNKEWPPEKVAEAFGVKIGQVHLVKHRLSKMIKTEVKRLERQMT